MPTPTDVRYALRDDAGYVIHDYHQAAPLSSFLPGIAGLWGMPLWCYYVNRGQGVACFGTQDKNHAIMEFQSANLHHRRVATEGFRTFLKVTRGGRTQFYEPFRTEQPDYLVHNRLCVLPHGLELSEENTTLGLTVTVRYCVIPNAPFAALGRQVTLTNTGDDTLAVELLDGFPKMVPYGMEAVLLQKLPFVSESYLKIENLDARVPFVSLGSLPSDTAETQFVQAGNFFLGMRDGMLLPAIVDPSAIFGEYRDLIRPYTFLADDFALPTWQSQHCMTPCAFVHGRFTLAGGASTTVDFLAGMARSLAAAQAIPTIAATPGWMAAKAAESAHEIAMVKDRFVVHGGSRELNLYASSTLLDNTIRGGLPLALPAGEGTAVLHVYARKHGDLERDYNWFSLAATPYSQGNGNFRDVNQNRRNDVWLNPDVEASNLRTFFNLLQADGYNPLVVKGLAFRLSAEDACAVSAGAVDDDQRAALEARLRQPFGPGELFAWLDEREASLALPREAFLSAVLARAAVQQDADFGEGYWTDHWTYNLDLMEGYLAIYPDRLRDVLVSRRDLIYWDTDVRVRPRDARFVLRPDGRVRSLDALEHDPAKAALIAGRAEQPHAVRTAHGSGAIYRTNLLGKLLCLLANKAATISPSGVGIEMDGGRPGWYDSINGIPSLFGATTSESFQLLRAARLLGGWLDALGLPDSHTQAVPIEVAGLLAGVSASLHAYVSSDADDRDHAYWEIVNTLKEQYREATHRGFAGAEQGVSLGAVRAFLGALEARLLASMPDATDAASGLPVTYVTHEAESYTVIEEGGQAVRSRRGWPCVRVTCFRLHRFPLFLEAPTHALHLETDVAKARALREAVRGSALFDEPLGMYLTNASIKGESPELGRIHAWPPGWFENENVFTHLEHKFLLSELRAGLYDAYFDDMRQCFLPFQDPAVFGRNPLENVSFIASSRHPRPYCHGRGFQPRSSGTTAEVLSMLLWQSFGRMPFRVDDGALTLRFGPTLAPWLFTEAASTREIAWPDGTVEAVEFPARSYTALFLGRTLVTYLNPTGLATYGPDAARITGLTLTYADGHTVQVTGDTLGAAAALDVREGRVGRVVAAMG